MQAKQQQIEKQPLLSDTLDDVDIQYDMEIIPAHRDDWDRDSLEEEKFEAV